MNWFSVVLTALSIIVGVSGAVALYVANYKNKYKEAEQQNYKNAVDSYKVTNDALSKQLSHQGGEIKELRVMHNESTRRIGELKGELKTYKELPLRELSTNQKIITEVLMLMAKHLKVEGINEVIKATH